MKPLAAARREVVAAMHPLPEVEAPLHEARGLVLSRSVVAANPVPPFANSGVDGFAVRSADLAAAPVELEVIGDLPAGTAPTTAVREGTAIRIMTGAPMPDGADAVVMVENTITTGKRVQVSQAARRGDHVRPAGGDFPAGTMVFDAGERLRAPQLGVLASIGVARPLVRRRPAVAVLSTGDELRSADTSDLPPGAIRDSNRPLLVGLLEELGVLVRDLGIIGDDAVALRTALEEATSSCDAVVTSGGVSMGEHDLVKQVLADLGEVEFWQVAMQPAKPFAFGRIGDTPLFGLPGNPVSAMVAFEQFVRPALLAAMGASRLFRPRVPAILTEAVSTNSDKTVFLRVEITAPWEVRLAGGQASNVLSALAAADAFAVIPVGVGAVAAGESVTLELFRVDETRTLAEANDD